MNYELMKDILALAEEFELRESNTTKDIKGFKKWIHDEFRGRIVNMEEPHWEGKENGRSASSIINTLIVHMNRYAKNYSRSAIYGSDFSTQEEFIYLINLKAFGAMTKMELIKKNVQDKPAGMLVINRLIEQHWVKQHDSKSDKRSKIIAITTKGLKALEFQMGKIRKASDIVTGNLNHNEKMELIRLLNKLEKFHHPIYSNGAGSKDLLDYAGRERTTALKKQ